MIEMLGLPFVQRALVAGVLVGFLASYYGVFVVQRHLSFLGTGLSHAAFGGVALGLLLGVEPLWIAVPFTVLVSLGINWVRGQTGLAGDTSVGIFFAISVALGVVFLSFRQQYSADAFAYLFGSILAVSRADLWVTFGVAAATLLSFPLWGRWAYAHCRVPRHSRCNGQAGFTDVSGHDDCLCGNRHPVGRFWTLYVILDRRPERSDDHLTPGDRFFRRTSYRPESRNWVTAFWHRTERWRT